MDLQIEIITKAKRVSLDPSSWKFLIRESIKVPNMAHLYEEDLNHLFWTCVCNNDIRINFRNMQVLQTN